MRKIPEIINISRPQDATKLLRNRPLDSITKTWDGPLDASPLKP